MWVEGGQRGGVERVLKKRGNRTHKKHRHYKMQSQRPLYARERARARARARVHGGVCTRALCVFLLSCFFLLLLLLPSSLRFPRPLRRTRAYTRTRPPPARSTLARACSTCAYGVQRTRKRRVLSSHGGFRSLHSLATSCNARRCPHLWVTLLPRNADRWNARILPSFSRGIRAREQKVKRHPPLRGSECGLFVYDETR